MTRAGKINWKESIVTDDTVEWPKDYNPWDWWFPEVPKVNYAYPGSRMD